MTRDLFRRQVRTYYDAKLRTHGATPAGADWNSSESQVLRFRQLEVLWQESPDASLLDYGCGYGALAAYVRSRGHLGSYVGFDLSDAMVAAAEDYVAGLDACRVTARRQDVPPVDYAVASGLLNVKQGADDTDWSAYVHEVLSDLATAGHRGFAFNALTIHSDPAKRRPDLFYADPLELFEFCRTRFSRFVTLVHDYPLYEFTIIVRR